MAASHAPVSVTRKTESPPFPPGRRLPPLARAILWAGAGFVVGAGATALIGRTPWYSEPAIVIGYLLALIGWLLGIGAWDAIVRPMLGLGERLDEGEGWRRYFRFHTDHKVVGLQYLVTSLVVFLVAGLLAMLMRVELMAPGMNFFPSRGAYNTTVSLHGTLMIFAVAALAIVGGLGNYFVPILIGAEDMAYPKLNALSYWFVPMGVLAFLAAPLLGGWDSGWTGYTPLSLTNASGQVLYNLGVYTLGLSSILGAINMIATVVHLRAAGLSWGRLPIFVWSMLTTSVLNLLFVQFVAMAMVMTLLDRLAGTNFFTARGNPILYQDVFWIFGHPEVYVLILPAFGLILEMLPVFTRRPLFAYRWAVAGMLAIAVMSAAVWTHHMFTAGVSESRWVPFMTSTELISVPTGFMYLAALGTLWRSRIRFRTPMLFVMGTLFNFLIGGLTGVFLADVPINFQAHDTFFVVGHFHYTIMGGMVFALLAGLYYWFPKFAGRMYNETAGRVHFWWTFLAFNATVFPMFWLGLHGMNRRIADYLPYLGQTNFFVSVAAFALGASFLVPVVNFVHSWVRGPAAQPNPWRGRTLEWQIPSPPPRENFPGSVEVVADFYGYGELPAEVMPHRWVPAEAAVSGSRNG